LGHSDWDDSVDRNSFNQFVACRPAMSTLLSLHPALGLFSEGGTRRNERPSRFNAGRSQPGTAE